jgi:hypothetical protein
MINEEDYSSIEAFALIMVKETIEDTETKKEIREKEKMEPNTEDVKKKEDAIVRRLYKIPYGTSADKITEGEPLFTDFDKYAQEVEERKEEAPVPSGTPRGANLIKPEVFPINESGDGKEPDDNDEEHGITPKRIDSASILSARRPTLGIAALAKL